MGIIADLRADLEKSARELLDEYKDRLMAEAIRLCKDESSAEDLVMCTFESYFFKRAKHDPQRGSLYGWLRTVMHNLHADSFRKRKVSEIVMSPEEIERIIDAQIPGERFEDTDETEYKEKLLKDAVNALSPKIRAAVVLHYFESMSVAEIARNLCISQDSVKNRLFYARKVLAKRLGKRLGKGGVAAVCIALFSLVSMAAVATLPVLAPVRETVASLFAGSPVEQPPAEVPANATAEPIAPITTFVTNENTETKEEEPMKLTKTLKSAAVAAAMTISAVGSASAAAETYTAASYAAADALVSQWDAIDNQATGTHDPDAPTWKALKGGVDFSLNGDAAWTEKGLSFPGDAESYALASSEDEDFSTAFPTSERTVEVVMTPTTVSNSAKQRAVFGPNFGLYIYTTMFIYATVGAANGTFYDKAEAEKTETFSSYYASSAGISSTLYRNGEAVVSKASYKLSSPPADVYLGGNGSEPFNGTIHSLRIYNRSLTEDEAAYNAAVDRIRFQGADPDEEIHALGIRLRQDGLLEYLLSVAAGSDGKVKVTANGETMAESVSAELWLTNGTPVQVEYVPMTAGDWHYLEGCPDDVAYVSPTVTTFTMPAKKWSVEEIPFAYQDDNIVTCDGSVRATNTYEGRTVYIFTNTTFKNAPVFLKRAARLDDLLVVAGGGGAARASTAANSVAGGGGGGGVIYQSVDTALASGTCFRIAVGAGGAAPAGTSEGVGVSGQDSVLTMPSATLTAKGGGAGSQSATAYGGGSGGGYRGSDRSKGTAGQGHDGGGEPLQKRKAAGGGGGAEEMGGNAYAVNSKYAAGKGGDGRWETITGELHCYGSGGGGSAQGSDGMVDEATGLPVFGEGGAESGGRGGFTGLITGLEWHDSWNVGQPGADALGGGGGAGGSGKGSGRGGDGTVVLAFAGFGDADRQLQVEEVESYPILNGAATPEPEVRCGDTVLAKGTDYDLFYENNTDASRLHAYMVVVGKGNYAGLVCRKAFKPADVRFVTPDGTGDGSDWEHPMSFWDAVNGIENGTYEIWCKAGAYDFAAGGALTIKNYVTIRGSFAGDQDDVSKRDQNGEKTVFDGGTTAASLFTSTYACETSYFTSRQVVFKDCVFTRCNDLAISTGTSTPFTFTRCDFLNNTRSSTSSAGAIVFHATGSSSVPITFKDCRFEGNVHTSKYASKLLYFKTVEATIVGCTFVTNGVALSQSEYPAGQSSGYGTVLVEFDIASAGSKIVNCDFRGNYLLQRGSNNAMIKVNKTASSIINCRFVGNSIYKGSGDIIYFTQGSTANYPSSIKNCTFAYNTFSAGTAKGSCIRTDNNVSQTTIENCIFWQNIQNPGNGGKRDVHSENVGTTTLAYSIFAELETSGKCVNVPVGDGCLMDDPLFVTQNSVEDYVTDTSAPRIDPAKIDEVLAIDVHLLSPEGYCKNGDDEWHKDTTDLSPAIDKGDPAADYANEPQPNGNRLNLGGYGNTAEASKTPACDPEIDSVTADYPDGLTQLCLTMQVGGEGTFVATATFYCSLDGGETYTASEPVGGAVNGGSVSWYAPFYLEPGTPVKYYATLSAAGADTKTSSVGETTAEGKMPPWEKPGDVVLVTPEGTPEGSGQTWASALDIATAMANLASHAGSEIWLKAGTYVMRDAITIVAAGKLRGGFAGDSAEIDKKDATGAKSVFDGEYVATRFFEAGYNDVSNPIIFEDCVFTRCNELAFYSYNKETPFTFTRCDFLNNTRAGSADGTFVFATTGSSSAPITFKDCRFEGNVHQNEKKSTMLSFSGAKVTIDGCSFVTNGVALSQTTKPGTSSGYAAVLVEFDIASAGSKIVNCDFRGNYILIKGQVIHIKSTKSSIENCRFVGNSIYDGTSDLVSIEYGTTEKYPTSIKNCTFAYNAFSVSTKSGGEGSCIGTSGASQTTIENCIFWDNIQNAANTGKRDVNIGNVSAATLSYSLFADLDPAGKCVNVQPGEGCIAGDPRFVTRNSVSNYLNAAELEAGRVAFDVSKIDEILAIDVHLKRFSPAVNTGNPKSDWSKEPVPNGKRINMGGYGGTTEATCTRPGGALIVR